MDLDVRSVANVLGQWDWVLFSRYLCIFHVELLRLSSRYSGYLPIGIRFEVNAPSRLSCISLCKKLFGYDLKRLLVM
jgi:hypothetical protein